VKLKWTKYSPHKPSPKQTVFLLYDGLEAFYGGAAGGGKSDALLMGALQYVDIPGYAALLMRRSYTDLALPGALMDRAHEWLKPYKEVKWDRETHTFNFPSGASITFGYIQTPKDKWRYQSAEVQYIGWDEITEFPDPDAYTFLFSRLRKLEKSPVPLRVRSASNPVGPGSTWVRKRFVEGGTSERIFLPATFQDNPHIDKESYLRSLQELPEATQARLIEGSWEAIDSAAFPHFDHTIHVVKPFYIPHDWRRWEAMDFGVSNPTAWYAAGVSPDGYAVVHGEYYSPGLISDHASKILTLRHNYWGEPSIALCDPSIQARTGFGTHGKGETVHSEFSRHGIYLVPANNDRRAGRVRISEALRPDPNLVFPEWHDRKGEPGSPRLFITQNCTELIEQMRYAPVDPESGDIIDDYWESRHGHAMAAARYLMTARILPENRPQVSDGTPVGRSWTDWTPGNTWREMV